MFAALTVNANRLVQRERTASHQPQSRSMLFGQIIRGIHTS